MSPEERRATFERKPRKPIARTSWLPRSAKPIPQRNEKRIARKAVGYRKVIASDFHKKLRYDAFLRSGGLCECERCAKIRRTIVPENVFTLSWGFPDQRFADTPWTRGEVERAYTPIPVWFTKKGGEPWRRFRSTLGETHHTSYKFFGEENPAELEFVEWQWDSCHQRIEAEKGTRRRFLKGRKAA